MPAPIQVIALDYYDIDPCLQSHTSFVFDDIHGKHNTVKSSNIILK